MHFLRFYVKLLKKCCVKLHTPQLRSGLPNHLSIQVENNDNYGLGIVSGERVCLMQILHAKIKRLLHN